MKEERWRWVKGYEGLYMVSDLGRVKRIAPGRGARPGHILKPLKCSNGYLAVCLSVGSRQKQARIHRLVAQAFLTPVVGKDLVNHINGDKTDNRVANLEWSNKSENAIHSYRVLGDKPHVQKGLKGKKLTANDARSIYLDPSSKASIAKQYGITETMVRAIKTGKSWGKATACLSIA